MRGFASRTGTLRNIKALSDAGWGWIVGPVDKGGPIVGGMPHAVDNGAWPAFTAFERGARVSPILDLAAFQRTLEAHGAGAVFIVVPDIVMGGDLSWAMTRAWLRKLRRRPKLRRAKLLIAVQDGFTVEMVRPFLCERIGLFLGGSTEWKEATAEMWGALAHERGAYFHIGRVNTIRRIKICARAGADSFDGSGVSRFATALPPLDFALRQADLYCEPSFALVRRAA